VLNQQTMSILHSLKLFGMAGSLEERLADPKQAALSHGEFVGLLVQDERLYRDNLRLRRLLKKAKLRQEAALEDIDYTVSRGLSHQVMMELANPQWITAHRNVLISGPTGVGKSYIACALGNSAARAVYTTLYARAPRLLESLQHARGDGSHLNCWISCPGCNCSSSTISYSRLFQNGNVGIYSRSPKAVTMPGPSSSPASVPSKTGTRL